LAWFGCFGIRKVILQKIYPFIDTKRKKPAAFNILPDRENVFYCTYNTVWTFESLLKLAQTIVDKIKILYSKF
jgi:hypothetical protein